MAWPISSCSIVADVRQQRPPRSKLLGRRNCLVQAEMRWMRPATQTVQHQHIQPLQQGHARRRDAIGVGAIGHLAEAVAEHLVAAVLKRNGHASRPQHIEWLSSNSPKDQSRHAASRIFLRHRIESIIERLANSFFDRLLAKDRQVVAEVLAEDAANRPRQRGGRRGRAYRARREPARCPRGPTGCAARARCR